MTDKKIQTAFIFEAMEKAVAKANTSEHPVNKIGASLFQPDTKSQHLVVTCNERPLLFDGLFPFDKRMGSSSQTIHAEMNSLFRFKGRLMGSHMCVTDPFCPNCGKMAAFAGVRHIYIDKDGFNKEFASRRADEFTSMSMRIAQKAGINVDIIDRAKGTIEPIFTSPIQTRLASASSEVFDVESDTTIDSLMYNFAHRFGRVAVRPYAFAIVSRNNDLKRSGILAFETMPPGFDFAVSNEKEGKYRYPIDPLNHLLMTLKKNHLQLSGVSIGSSHLPTSRALVHAVRLGVRDIVVGSLEPEHDVQAPEAVADLKPIMSVRLITPHGQSQNT